MKYLVLLLLIFFLVYCNSDNTTKQNNDKVSSTEITNNSSLTNDEHVHRNYSDTSHISIECMYGNWTIDSIMIAGGTNISESLIKKQLGERISIQKKVFTSSFLGNKIKGFMPRYNFTSIDPNTTSVINGRSYYQGYQSEKDSIVQLIVAINDYSFFYEVIHCNKIISYYDGRLFIYQKDE